MPSYNLPMARGWESKSVEAQQEDAGRASVAGKPRLTREEADRLREKESLRLSLQRVVQEIEHSQNAWHRAMLEQAQAELQRRIARLEGS
ncbi:MAG: hypothetical protein WAM78_18870 [Candidatus Sulfotelmatobacter sp.]